MADARDFGAAADGRTDNSQALQHAIDQGDGVLLLGRGVYRITRPLVLDTARRGYLAVRGEGTAQLLMDGPGPALQVLGGHQGTATPRTVKPSTWQRERMPMISGLEILGRHKQADGIQLVQTMQPTIQNVLIRNCRYGVHLRKRNRNLLLSASHIYDCGDTGVFFDDCNLHQVIITGCHISYCKRAGIRQFNGDVHNIQITGNDIEYNSGLGENSGEIVLEAPEGVISEYTIGGNTLQATIPAAGANVLIRGKEEDPALAVRLITITGNVLGSRQRNIDLSHCSTVAISGNTIYSGGQLNLRMRNSRHCTVSGNTFATRPAGWNTSGTFDGAELIRCVGCSLEGNLFNEVFLGREDARGCVTLEECRHCSVSGSQILNPSGCGIFARACAYTRIANNSIVDDRSPPKMPVAVRIVGGSRNVVQGNAARRGSEGKAFVGEPPAADFLQNHEWTD